MKKLLLVCIALLFIISAKAQPYKTMFPEGRKWVELYAYGIGGESSQIFYVQKDTIINAKSYHKVTSEWRDLYYREDTINGKVWTYAPGCIDSDLLYIDYSLQKGDTFNLVYPSVDNLYDSLEVVDTVFVKDGRKHIVFRWQGLYNERYEFIEGVGCNFGLFYKSCSMMATDIYMLCAEDNGLSVYANKQFNGNCYPLGFPSKINDLTKAEEINIYPNPANDIITLSFAKQLPETTTYTIIDFTGRRIKTGVLEQARKEHQITVKELPVGMYQVIIGTDRPVKFVKQ